MRRRSRKILIQKLQGDFYLFGDLPAFTYMSSVKQKGGNTMATKKSIFSWILLSIMTIAAWILGTVVLLTFNR